LAANQFLTIWADNEPGESTPSELHTNFRLASSTGAVTLARMQGAAQRLGRKTRLGFYDYRK
jgi:hypothetical protein